MEMLRAPKIEFVAEQDGKFEQGVKEALLPVLQRHPEIQRGYLVSVMYDGKQRSVALCLESSTGPSEQVAKEVSSVFREQAGRDVHLDILFLTAEQRVEVRSVARPFYHGRL